MEFQSPIDAIKAIRTLNAPQLPTVTTSSTGIQITYNQSLPGLHETKDVVEAIMALGVKRYKENLELAKQAFDNLD